MTVDVAGGDQCRDEERLLLVFQDGDEDDADEPCCAVSCLGLTQRQAGRARHVRDADFNLMQTKTGRGSR